MSGLLRILFVEDDEYLRAALGELLGGPDRKVISCGSAEQAIELLESQAFDVLVTDVSLPGMSGTDLARAMVARNPEQWIVLCSGYEIPHPHRSIGRNVRALLKPFEIEQMDELLQTVRQTRADGT